MNNTEVRNAIIENNLVVFHSDYGKKGVNETWRQRLAKIVKQSDQFKDFQNLNIITGQNNIVDIDLDCEEAIRMVDCFLTPTGMMFGKESTPTAHRLYKVIDLEKKHTRTPFQFASKEKSMLVEFRANDHYTMCLGMHDSGQNIVWSQYSSPVEITYDKLFKQVSKLAVACAILRKFPQSGKHDEYIRRVINALYQHSVEEDDTRQIIEAVISKSGCSNCFKDNKVEADKLAKIKATYSKDKSEHIVGLPDLVKTFGWNEDEKKDFKTLLYKITGRHTLPEFTNVFVERIAYMMKQKKFYDLEDKEMYDGEAIDMKYAKHFKNGKYTPLKFWKQHPDSKVCVDFTYKPNDAKRFLTVNKKLMINVYEKNEDLQPDKDADISVWTRLWERIVPEPEYRNHMLDFMAYHIQEPGKKIRHALIFQSDEFQLGKGSIFDVMRDILGNHNTNVIDLKQALDKGKGYLLDKQFVLIDEAKASGTWNEKSLFVNTLKTLITGGTAGIRLLYKDYTEADTCTNYIINTNYRDAFPLPYNEVRYFVYFSEAKRDGKLLEDFHNARLYGNLNAGVLYSLMERNLSKFKPLGVAPHTPYRDLMCKLADKPIKDYVKEKFQQGIDPFNRDLMTVTELFDWLCNNTKVRVTRHREVSEALQDIGGIRVENCKVTNVGDYVTVYIMRNHVKYKNMTAAELGKEYKPFATGKMATHTY